MAGRVGPLTTPYTGGGPGTDYLTQQATAQKVADEQRANTEFSARQKAAEAERVAAFNREHARDLPMAGSQGTLQTAANAGMATANANMQAGDRQLAASVASKGQANRANTNETMTTAVQNSQAAQEQEVNKRRQQVTDEREAQKFQQQQRFNEQKMAAMAGLSASSGTSAGSMPAPYNPGAMIAAEDASFARAKDRVAQVAHGRNSGIADSFASRGLSGSGLEADASTSAANQSQGELGDFARQQAISGLDQAFQKEQLGLSARGQDISASNAAAERKASLLRSMLSANIY